MMVIEVFFILWLLTAFVLLFELRLNRVIIFFGIFSLMASLIYLLLGAPDVAIAEAGIAAFTTVFLIIFIGGYYKYHARVKTENRATGSLKRTALLRIVITMMVFTKKNILSVLFLGGIFALFIHVMPQTDVVYYLKDLFLLRFMAEVGGENAVAAILLGYRVYDTLFEALVLVIALVAVVHMSHNQASSVPDGHHSEIETSGMAAVILRIISPLILIFGIYLMLNGHISAGGGFQGGLAIAGFFICRYMIHDIYDLPIKKVLFLEKVIFIGILILAAITYVLGAAQFLPIEFVPIYQVGYLIAMNVFIGIKVACVFFALFYRYIAIESSDYNEQAALEGNGGGSVK